MLLADFSTAMIPEGKVRMARDKRERLPMGLILDKEGNATADPNDFYNGGMLQCFAGHKGYALVLMVEVLSGCLSGAYDYTGQDRGNGLFLLAIDPAGYDLPSAFTGHLDRLLGKINAVSPAPGFAEVFLPGEPEMISRTLRLLHGIDVPADTWNELKKLAGEFSVDADQVVA
jgi:ureidoglycolate dehydrogenase (NAD+)